MCIAIANKKGFPITKEHFNNSWENNSHGGGLLWAEKGKVFAHYELTDKDNLYKVYSEKVRKSNVLLHMRITSKGVKSVENCHPFLVNDKLGFIHNGTIFSNLEPYGKEKSDTCAFNEQYLQQLPKNFYRNTVILKMLEKMVGTSKIVMMNGQGEFTFLNESKGSWDGANWFSNDSYKRVNNYVYQGDKKVYKNTKPTPPKAPVYSNPGMKLLSQKNQRLSTWREEMTDGVLPTGFDKTIYDIIAKTDHLSQVTAPKLLGHIVTSFRAHKFRSVRFLMTEVFEDWTLDSSDSELYSCWKYFYYKWLQAAKEEEEQQQIEDFWGNYDGYGI